MMFQHNSSDDSFVSKFTAEKKNTPIVYSQIFVALLTLKIDKLNNFEV